MIRPPLLIRDSYMSQPSNIETPEVPLTADDIIFELEKEDEELAAKPVEVKEEEVEESEEEIEEAPEEEIKLEASEERKEEENEFDDVIHRISRKQLLKDYPDLEKKYPQLIRAYYGNQEYRKIFPTLDSVKDAKAKLDEFNSIESDLAKGSSVSLLKGLKEKSGESYNLMVDNLLTNLRNVDQEAYYHVIGNNIREAVIAMGYAAEKTKNDDLMTAAKMVNEFFLGEGPVQPPTKFKQENKNPEIDKLTEERQKFNSERLNTYQGEVTSKVDNAVSKAVEKYIDPKDAMTPYIKKAAINEAVSSIKSLMKKDAEFQSLVEKSWKEAEKNNFDAGKIKKIQEALISKAQVLLSPVLRKVRNDALQGTSKTKDPNVDRKGPMTNRGSSSNPKGGNSKVPEFKKGMNPLDYLNMGD